MRSKGNESVYAVRLSRQQRLALLRKARDLNITPSAVLRFALNRLMAEQPTEKEAKDVL